MFLPEDDSGDRPRSLYEYEEEETPWIVLLTNNQSQMIVIDAEKLEIDAFLAKGWVVEKDAGFDTAQDAIEYAETRGFNVVEVK